MQSVLHYAQDINDIPLLKNALGVLMKMVIAWGGGVDTMNLSKIDVALKAPLKKNAKSPSSHANVDSTSILNSSSSSDSSQMSASGPQPPPTPKVALPGFDQFLYSSIVPILFEIPRKICLKDAQSMLLVMGEIANFHRIVFWGAKKEEYAQFLTTVFFPSVLQCPQDVTLSFVDALRTKDGKAFRKYLQEFYKPAK